jgi:hypothetical protein
LTLKTASLPLVTGRSNGDVAIADVHRAIGAVVVAATSLELGLAQAVASLTRSPLTTIVVQGERGTTLVRMAKRLLKRGVGSTAADESSGRTKRLGLISAADTAAFEEALTRAERLLDTRDEVVHSMWVANLGQPGLIHAERRTRSTTSIREWTLAELERLRQDLANVQVDIFISNWNTDGSGMPRSAPRQGDVM